MNMTIATNDMLQQLHFYGTKKPLTLLWYYVKKKYKLNRKIFKQLISIFLLQFIHLIISSIFPYIVSHMHWEINIHNGYESLRCYKKFQYIQTQAYRHVDNQIFYIGLSTPFSTELKGFYAGIIPWIGFLRVTVDETL